MSSSFHLRIVDFLINGIGCQKILVRSHSVNLSVVKNDDFISIHHGGNALSDDQLCYLCQRSKGLTDSCFRGSIYSAGGIIKNQYFWVFQQSSGNAEPLFLPAGDIDAALSQIGVQSLRHMG